MRIAKWFYTLFGQRVLDLAAQKNLEAELLQRRGLGIQTALGAGEIRRIYDLDMVGFVARHHLVAGDPAQHQVHHRPLRRGQAPALLGLRVGQANRFAQALVAVDPAPDHPARLADPLDGAAA
jgi:hypothetical protein